MSAFAFAWRIWRRDRTARRAAALTAGAIAVTTALMVMLSSVPGALQQRAERTAWRGPDPTRLAGPKATATPAPPLASARVLLASNSYEVGGHEIQQVNVATRGAVAPPAGLPKVPAPGEVLVSPAVATLLRGPDGATVRASLPGRVVGSVGPAALTGPKERVVVAGRSPAAVQATAAGLPVTDVVGRDDLRSARAEANPVYVALVWIALGLLVLPAIALTMQIARLLATRREERSAALQLVGAEPGWTMRAAIFETATAAAAGALVGAAIGVPVARLLLVELSFNGTTWFAGDLTTPWPLIVAAVVGLPALTGLATAAAHRSSGSPLGAIQRHRPRPLRASRLLFLPLAAGMMLWGLTTLDGDGSVVPLLIALAAVVACTAVVGPLVVLALGHAIRRVWRRPATLLAARRMIDEPRAVWRIASGPVLAAFVAATMLAAGPTLDSLSAGDQTAWERQHLLLDVPAKQAPATVAAVRAGLREQGDHRPVSLVRPGSDGRTVVHPGGASSDDLVVAVRVGRDAAAADRAASAFVRAAPGAQVHGYDRLDPRTGIVQTISAGAIGTLLLSSLLGALATAVTSVGTVLDRRRTLAALRMAGTPVPILRRMMEREVALPSTLGVLASGVGGALFAVGLLTIANRDPIDVVNLPLIAVMVGAVGLPLLAVRAAGSTIERVTADGPSAE